MTKLNCSGKKYLLIAKDGSKAFETDDLDFVSPLINKDDYYLYTRQRVFKKRTKKKSKKQKTTRVITTGDTVGVA